MAYLALYREWRPKTFGDLVGQEHITKTLLNALRQDKVAHAFLFCGPRGTGKTTTAKVLAKALNCQNRQGEEPCNLCPSCQSIDQGNAMEVYEIDAASNRGIDEIRDLREKINLSAGESKHKIYIIDEVHMLTTEAFNALLKTLEEPPQRVIFILATTEVQKIPLTILSRVQRFDFHRIPAEQIQMRLQKVCESLNRSAEADALAVIAQKSEGGLRDALSLLDQCLLLDEDLRIEQVYQVLGMLGEEYSAQLVDQLIAGDYARTLEVLSEGIGQGRDPRQILRELLDYLRQTLLYAATQQCPYTPEHIKAMICEQCERIGIKRVLRWISILLQGEGQLRYASNARLAVEMLLVQVIYDAEGPAEPSQVAERLAELEQEIRKLSLGQTPESSASPKRQPPPQPLQPARVKDQVVLQEASPIKPSVSQPPSADPDNKIADTGLTFNQIAGRWPEVLEQVRKLKKSTHAFLMEGRPDELRAHKLVIVFKNGFSFHRDKVNQPENRETIEKVLAGIFAIPLVLECLMESECQKHSAEPEPNPVIKKVEEVFGAELVVIRE